MDDFIHICILPHRLTNCFSRKDRQSGGGNWLLEEPKRKKDLLFYVGYHVSVTKKTKKKRDAIFDRLQQMTLLYSQLIFIWSPPWKINV